MDGETGCVADFLSGHIWRIFVPYTIETHRHNYAAWAASRASSHSKTCKFKVAIGKMLLEHVRFGSDITDADNLPTPKDLDDKHREWRESIIQLGNTQKFGKKNAKTCQFTHGIAAKLINMYVKSVFVCGPQYDHDNVRNFHPPIDGILLKALEDNHDDAEGPNIWAQLPEKRWTEMDSDQYESTIECVRQQMGDNPLWKIEENWRGYQ